MKIFCLSKVCKMIRCVHFLNENNSKLHLKRLHCVYTNNSNEAPFNISCLTLTCYYCVDIEKIKLMFSQCQSDLIALSIVLWHYIYILPFDALHFNKVRKNWYLKKKFIYNEHVIKDHYQTFTLPQYLAVRPIVAQPKTLIKKTLIHEINKYKYILSWRKNYCFVNCKYVSIPKTYL